MDRLDQFAAAALTGLLAINGVIFPLDQIATDAYDIAQAMIKESAVRNDDGSRKEEAGS